MNSLESNCSHNAYQHHIRFFACDNLVTSFEYKQVLPYRVIRSTNTIHYNYKELYHIYIKKMTMLCKISYHVLCELEKHVGLLQDNLPTNVDKARKILNKLL